MCLKLLASSQIELSYICVDVDTLEFKRPRASRAVPARNDPLISSSAPDGHNASHGPIIRRLVAPKIPWFRAIFSEIDIRDGPAQKPPRLRVRKCLTLHGCKVLCSTAQNHMFVGHGARSPCNRCSWSIRPSRDSHRARRDEVQGLVNEIKTEG